MIKFFRQSYAIQYVVIALLAVALWIPAFLSGHVVEGLDEPVTPIYNLMDRLLAFSPFAKLAFAFVLLALEALFFNTVLVRNQIVGKVSTMGAFVFVLMMSFTQTQTNFYPFALSLFFILLSINVVYEVYLSQKPELDLLKAGIYVALASMCYFPSILLILWVMAALPIVKKGSLRLELIPVTGFLFVYFFYFVGVYLFGDFFATIKSYQAYFSGFQLSVEGFNLLNVILLAFFLGMAVLLLFGNASFEKAIAVRSKMTMVVLLLLVALITLFIGDKVMFNGMIFIVLAVVFSYEFTCLNNTGWTDLIMAVVLLLVFANHYYFKLL